MFSFCVLIGLHKVPELLLAFFSQELTEEEEDEEEQPSDTEVCDVLNTNNNASGPTMLVGLLRILNYLI